ncbi:DNA polymerase kappa isoform X2 [Malania oleifera]|uniref:DNA polymerase kappa isoform X2 n=1 Tax=Malania oleifera TaxID=397392 RepID=UPI0025AE2F91|nr:DNA polymerase kappa isoform X2 [Malania oleifera]
MKKGETSGEAARPWESYHTAYTNAKAGMDGVDKEKVQRIVYEMSKGSKYFENEGRREALIRQKIEHMRARCANLSAADISHYQTVADKRILELEARRDLSKIWLHVDMDAFYAAVETLSNPSLKGKPMAVGSMSMISTANYEARRFGVRAAMPGFIARKLCPQLIFVPTDFEKYTHYSALTRKVFQKYDPNFMAASLDEAYLDITEVCEERGATSGEIAEELRKNVYEETGLTCSAGVAPNRLLAKVCSDINKPNGQFVLPNDRLAVMIFISSLPVRKIGGIGKVTEHILRDVFGINTCEEMLEKSGLLCALFSHSSADFFMSVGLGLGQTDTPQFRLRKSISSERTFSATSNETFLYKKLGELAEMLSDDMQREGLSGRTLTLKLKTASFEVRTRAVTLQKYICSSEEILNHASKLLKAELPVSLRLIGLRLSQFNEDKDGAPSDPTQKSLTDFIVSGGASGRSMDDNGSLGLDVNDNQGHLDTADLLDSNHVSVHCDICTLNNDADENERSHGPRSDRISEKVNADLIQHSDESDQSGCFQLAEPDSSFSGQLKGNNIDRVSKRANPDNEAVSSPNQSKQLSWVDDYKCSLCGVELPPSFVVERQEHADFHLAERLQEEESLTNSRYPIRQSCILKGHNGNQSKHKKKKPSKDGKHLTIDLFFVKSAQNF